MKRLKLYRLVSESATYGETRSAVVCAHDPAEAVDLLRRAFELEQVKGTPEYEGLRGYLATPANPYVVEEEIPLQVGLILAEGQDG